MSAAGARARRPARVFTSDGVEVFITKVCPRCRAAKPLKLFGLRRMANGQIRDCSWCRKCRSNHAASGARPAKPFKVTPREKAAANAETHGAPDHRAQPVSPGPRLLALDDHARRSCTP